MSGAQPISPIPARDFTAAPIVARPDPLALAATEYGMLATAEETDRMLRRVYGPDRIPGTESRRHSQMGETKTCGMTGCDLPARSCGWCYDHCNAIHRHERPACAVEGCERTHYALGLCQAHYGRQRRTNDQSAALAAWSPRAAPTIPTAVEIKAEMFDALSAAREEIEAEMFEAHALLSEEVTG